LADQWGHAAAATVKHLKLLLEYAIALITPLYKQNATFLSLKQLPKRLPRRLASCPPTCSFSHLFAAPAGDGRNITQQLCYPV